ncbi:O-methyltransferase [Fennellomyces sp. T-0311]|nr:O-methyltransferase [Fennellomyces sp. T-0311]
MMIGNVCSKYLHQLVHVLQPSRILEIGTFTGTSTICMSLALRPGGKIFSLDVDPKAQEVARRYIDQLQLTDRVHFRLGNGLESFLHYIGSYPYVHLYVDADKPNYISYFDMIMNNNLLSDRGMIIADNVLFCGKVHRDAGYEDPAPFKYTDFFTTGAKSMLEFNQHVLRDPRVHQVTLPLFDGVSIITKRRK